MKAGTIRLQIMPNRTGQPEPGSSSTGAQKYFSSAAAESACRQYRVVREVLLPEAELLLRQQGGWIANPAERGNQIANLVGQKLNCKFG